MPAALVLLGAGSVMATLLSWFPAMVVLSEQKALVFGLATATLAAAGVSLLRSSRRPCPLDPVRARRCRQRLLQARLLYLLSCVLFLVGSAVAYGLPLLHPN